MKKRVFLNLGSLVASNHISLLFVFLLVTALSMYVMTGLKVKMSFKDLMPRDDPTVIELDRIIDHFSSSSNLIVAISGNEEELVQFAEDVAPQIEAIKPEIKRVDYTSDRDFLARYGFMLTRTSSLKNMRSMFKDTGLLPFLTAINDNFEKTYIEDDEGLSNAEKEDQAVQSLDGIRNYLLTMKQYIESDEPLPTAIGEDVAERFLLGEPYYLSPERDMILLFAQPAFPIDNMDTVIPVVNRVDSLVTAGLAKYPSLKGGLTGTMTLARDETIGAQEDMNYTSIISFVLIILLFIFSFRMIAAPLLAGISLIVGVIWTGALAQIIYGHLNMMTSMFAVVLMGLGIDFNIHIISAYQDARAHGDSPAKAILSMYSHCGNGVLVGAMTTALAFLTMLVSKNTGMKEFGFIAGLGVLLTMLSAMIVLPPMLLLRERLSSRKKAEKPIKAVSFTFLGNASAFIARNRWLVAILTLLLTGFFLYQAMNIRFNYNYLDLEPKGLSSVVLQDKVIEKYDLTTDMFMVTTETIAESRAIADKAKQFKSIGMVSSISSLIPSTLEQEERKPLIEVIRDDLVKNTNSEFEPANMDAFIDELYRLEDNIIELSQLAFMGGQDKVDRKAKTITGDMELPPEKRSSIVQGLVAKIESKPDAVESLKAFHEAFQPRMHEIALGMTDTTTLTLDILPENIRNRYLSKDGKQFLVTIYPRKQVWDFAYLKDLKERMHEIDPKITGMPLVFYILIQYIGKDGRLAAMLTIAVVFLLLLVDFRSLKNTLVALIPLFFGAIWMVGIMKLVGMQLNILNLMGVPLILGMGIDDGVHILNRYRVEGSGNIKSTFTSTGKAVLLTTLTTMLAFGSMGFATMRGLASLGITLFIGIAACFVTTLLVIPAALAIIDKTKEK